MSRDYKAIFAKIEAAKPFKEGAKVTHKDDAGTDREGTVYEITLEQGCGSKIWLDPYRTCSFEDLELVSAAVSKHQKLIDTFTKLEVLEDVSVSLTYEDDADVWHCNGDADETAVGQTHTIEALVGVARSGIKFQEDLISDMRDLDHLDDYERDSYDFENYCKEVIAENYYDYHDYIECTTEQYDHKRGNTTVTASLETTVGDLTVAGSAINELRGWKAEFATSNGTITIEI
jgi:hypothetical protein